MMTSSNQAVGHHSPPEKTTTCDSTPYSTCQICRLEHLGNMVRRDSHLSLVHFTRAELVLRSEVQEMKRNPDLTPDEVTFNTLMDGCARHGLYERGMQLLEETMKRMRNYAAADAGKV